MCTIYLLRECGSSGEDVSVNAVTIPRNWGKISSDGRNPEEGIGAQFCLSLENIPYLVFFVQK